MKLSLKSYFCIKKKLMENKRKSLRFGLMINSLTVECWQYETIKLLMDNGMKLSLVIQKSNNADTPSLISRLKKKSCRWFLFGLWNDFFFKARSKFPADITELTQDTPAIFCRPIIKNDVFHLEDIDIQEIRNQNLDFIIKLGFERIGGEVLNTAKYGVWSFSHGILPGFWEFMNRKYSTCVCLSCLKNETTEAVLREIQLSTILHSYRAHLEQLHFESSLLPLQMYKDIIYNETQMPAKESKIVREDNVPGNFNMIQYFWKSVWRRIMFHLDDMFCQEDWNVAYCECDIKDFVESDDRNTLDVKWFKKPKKNCYFADPFVITTKKDTYIFFEWYSYPKGKADLAVALKSEGFNVYHKLTDFSEHRSYPYVFEHEGVVYCMPEANKTNKLTLYRFDEERLAMEKDSILLEGFPIVDATLYHNEGKWYLFLVNQKKSHTHLEIFSSNDLRGGYVPHELNPVMIDCSKARPAGKIFDYNGMTIRPSQNSTEHYGQSVCLEIIERLTDKQFVTKDLGNIMPIENSDYNKGIHTVNSDGNIVVFDGKRFVFTLSGFKQQLKQKLYK